MSAELEAALARGHALTAAGRLEAAEVARDVLAALLELEPMGDRPDERATWDDVIAYTAKALDSRKMTHATVKRRTAQLVAAVGMPEGTSWPEALAEVMHLCQDPEAGS
jgi:hypothetical protein